MYSNFNSRNDVEILKDKIKSNPSLLRDMSIKKQLFKDRHLYFNFVVYKISYEAFESLFDDEGIELFISSLGYYLVQEIQYILFNGYYRINEHLFKNKLFCKTIMDNLDEFKLDLTNRINEKCSLLFMKFVIENYPNDVSRVYFECINRLHRLTIIKSLEIPLDLCKRIIFDSNVSASHEEAVYLASHDDRVRLLKPSDDLGEIIYFSENIGRIPESFLADSYIVKKICRMDSVKNYRLFIDRMAGTSDVSLLDDMRKRYYEQEILSFLSEANMLKRYWEFYQELCLAMNSSLKASVDLDEIIDRYFVFAKKTIDVKYPNNLHGIQFRNSIKKYFESSDKEGLLHFLERESHRQLADMIVDYHFQTIPYNFFLDLIELMNFSLKYGNILSEEELGFYYRILNIDDMSYEEVLKLHEELKGSLAMEKLYNQWRLARNKAVSLMNEEVLTEESIQRFKDNKISKELGVDVYVLDGADFCTYVRGYRVLKTESLVDNPIVHDTDRNSYSLVGSSQLGLFLNPKDYYNFVYLSEMPEDQVVHVSSTDSRSSDYERNVNEASIYANELKGPRELLDSNSDHTELVVIVPNDKREKDDELNNRLAHPEIFGIYCHDNISDSDVNGAKALGSNIVLVKTRSYEKSKSQNNCEIKLYNSNYYDGDRVLNLKKYKK